MKKKKDYTQKTNQRIINQNKNINPNLLIEIKTPKFNNNYIQGKNQKEKYIKKNLSVTNLTKEKDLIKINSPKINNVLNINTNKNRVISKHSSMKYFKITPIINPLYDRAYFNSKINLQTANNMNNPNINIDKMIRNVRIEETPSTSRKSRTLNKIENMPIHIMNNINIINNNLVEDNNTIKNDNIIFMKKRILDCHRTSLSKPKNENKINRKEIYELYMKENNDEINNYNDIKTKENFYDNYMVKKYNQNLFNKTSIRKSNNINNKSDKNKDYLTLKNLKAKNMRNIIQKDYNTTNNNINIENNDREQADNINFKELNLEDFLLIMQKLDDIKSNIEYIYSFYNLNFEQNYISTKKILKLNHSNTIKLYDLFLFYMGSSFDGLPEKLFKDKKYKYYLHIWTVIFIISIGILFTIEQNINLTDVCSQDILKLITLQDNIFLIFCDLIIQKLSNKYKHNIWVGQIFENLKKKSITNISNHIIQMRTLVINSYEIINNLLTIINNFDNNKNNIIKNNSKFLYDNFYNATWKVLNAIKINQLEESFNQYIFKSFNLNNNNKNNTIEAKTTFKKSIIKNNFYQGYHTNKNISSKYSNKNIKLNISKNNPKKIILKNSNSNPSLIKKAKNTLNIKLQNYPITNIIQYEIIIPSTPCPCTYQKSPFLNFPQKKPYTLIIDLDETMASFKFIDMKKGIGILYLRPNLENFLEVIKDYYEIIPFTSASRDYADIALDLIEKNERNKYFDFRLYREHTTQFGTKYIKDLSKLGRDLSKVIIVDNLSQCFKLNKENGILISSFFGEDENDKALIELQKILIKIYYDNDDIRKGLVKYKDDIFNKISQNYDNNDK